ncbi:MAG: non-ribosomal peptide synthetase, partial [bacterium]|nr:non-ribosomal peptide synthetase [bacterium]
MKQVLNLKERALAAGQNKKERNYWLEKLSGETVKSVFPYDKEKNGNPPVDMDTLKFKLSGKPFVRVMALSNKSDFRLHVILVAGLMLLIDKYNGSPGKNVTIGAPTYKQEVKGEHELVNTVVTLRNQSDGHLTFKEFLLQVSKTVVEANEHQNYPIEVLLDQLNLPASGN